jgi:hypothetical protein
MMMMVMMTTATFQCVTSHNHFLSRSKPQMDKFLNKKRKESDSGDSTVLPNGESKKAKVVDDSSGGRSAEFASIDECFAVPVSQFKNNDDYTAYFERMARYLTHDMVLQVASSSNLYRFVELEFYLTSSHHPDPFPHAHAIQVR